MKKIIFVDDEINILQGLKRMLHSYRNEWQMSFANSGQEALEMMQKEQFDIVVSDLRMPNIDGAKLLQTVSELYPRTARIVLSGHADKEMILKVTTTAHQYLTKPCDSVAIKEVIDKIVHLREIIYDQDVINIVSRVKSIPVLPDVYLQIVNKLKDSSATLKEIGQIISKDIALTAKILQLVNSSFFGLYRKINDPIQAVSLLGI
ncbi:MAG: response regulator, partial [Candidatus Cloacimonetes bacterium]|nr:response regulator [Candidatus Cloacimonadota bacterium]